MTSVVHFEHGTVRLSPSVTWNILTVPLRNMERSDYPATFHQTTICRSNCCIKMVTLRVQKWAIHIARTGTLRSWPHEQGVILYSYFTVPVGENVLKVPRSILTFIERLQVKLLRNLEFSIVNFLQNNNSQSTKLSASTESCYLQQAHCRGRVKQLHGTKSASFSLVCFPVTVPSPYTGCIVVVSSMGCISTASLVVGWRDELQSFRPLCRSGPSWFRP
jgi:hypothetical protein